MEQRKLVVQSSSDSRSKRRPRMSPELIQSPGYIAVNSAIRDAIGHGKKPNAIPNVVMRYLECHQKIAKWQLFQES